ncbi:MAG: Mur ligase family protein [Actinobacteria bacterium]|nr:Mur ligase family protein [Actinomycetota bacterium]
MKNYLALFVFWYLRFFAKLKIKKIKPLIIGVGGASGKTSLSNFIYIIFSEKYKVRQGRGKNSQTGIPLDILRLEIKNYTKLEWLKALMLSPIRVLFDSEKFDVYIAEMGIDSPVEPKNMSYLLKIIKPQIGILTNISFEHSVYFDPLIKTENSSQREKNILSLTAEQEGLLLKSIEKDGTAVLNIDDKNIAKLKNEIKSKIVTVSRIDKDADFYIENIKNFISKFILEFRFKNKQYVLKISNPLPEHFAYSFVFAIATANAFNIEIEDAIKALERGFFLPSGRMSVFNGIKNTVIIDSSYNNATLGPILDLLSYVKEIGKQRRKVGIIGDMRELGTMSKVLHEKVAVKILETLDIAILIGPLSKEYIAPVLKMNDFPFYSFDNFTFSKKTILEVIKPKDIILVKGSQNTLFLERVVQMLLQNPKDQDKLCRRGEYWDRIRERTP